MVLSIVSCGKKENKNPYNLDLCKNVEVVESQSYFSDAIPDDEGKTAQYICIVTLESKDEKEHDVKIYGDFSDLAEEGLVQEKSVYGTYAGKEKIEVSEAGLALIKVIFTLTLPDDYKEGDKLTIDESLPDMYVVNAN